MQFFETEIQRLREQNLFRNLQTIRKAHDAHIEMVDGTRLIDFGSNNYLGLANFPAAVEKAQEVLATDGMGAKASRLLSGNNQHQEDLENLLAKFVGAETALLFPSGYAANIGAISALVGREDVIFSDALNHASMIDGARLSGAKIFIFPHRDTQALETLLQEHAKGFRRKMILTEGVFSMEGTCAPLPRLNHLALAHQAMLYVDDAHGFGVLGDHGRGVFSHHHVPINQSHVVYLGTLGKSMGAMGGFVAGKGNLRNYLINFARTFIFATGLPPSICAFSAMNLSDIIKSDTVVKKLRQNIQYFSEKTKGWQGFSRRESQLVPIQPFWIGDEKKALDVASSLRKDGIFVRAIRPPTVPRGEARIRMTLTAAHEHHHLDALVAALRGVAA